MVSNETSKQYRMVNPTNGARIQCTEAFLTQWLARGFHVEEIILPDGTIQQPSQEE